MPSILNSDDGVVSGTSGLKSTGGNDGLLNIQSNGSTVVAMTGSGVSVTGTLTASGATTLSGAVSASSLSVNSNNISADNSLGFRNRIINGDMRIDQRNAGASVTLTNTGIYTVDRWIGVEDTDGVMTAQQSSTAPTGFVNSLICTTTTADASLGATQYCVVAQSIEGLNVADLGWGTANAKTVTLSFWTRSSLTGTFGGVLKNSAANRSYPFTYTISAANTWEQKSVTIAGDTSGTWLTTNGIGIQVNFGLGVGSTYSGTAGAWAGSNLVSATGATSVIGTLNATWYITGVQLEVGSVATPFERRPYGTELALCQRYFESSMTVAPADSMTVASTGVYCLASSGATPTLSFPFKTTKRDSPTLTYYAPLTTSPSGKVREDATGTIRNVTGGGATAWGAIIGITGGAASVAYQFGYWASSEL